MSEWEKAGRSRKKEQGGREDKQSGAFLPSLGRDSQEKIFLEKFLEKFLEMESYSETCPNS